MKNIDVSIELEMLREKLLFVETAFFRLLGESSLTQERARGLGNIVSEAADSVLTISRKLYGEDPGPGVPTPPANSRPAIHLLKPNSDDSQDEK